jgi:hypothetical protein
MVCLSVLRPEQDIGIARRLRPRQANADQDYDPTRTVLLPRPGWPNSMDQGQW